MSRFVAPTASPGATGGLSAGALAGCDASDVEVHWRTSRQWHPAPGDRSIHYALLSDPALRHAAKPDPAYTNDRASYHDLPLTHGAAAPQEDAERPPRVKGLTDLLSRARPNAMALTRGRRVQRLVRLQITLDDRGGGCCVSGGILTEALP